MKKIIFGVILASTLLVALSQCFNQSSKGIEKTKEVKLITHKEGADTLRRDTNAPLQALVFRSFKGNETYDFYKKNDISSLFKSDYPDNGFYGADRYRIEFIITEAKRDSFNVNIYHVKGKNRHKKVITPFEGFIRLLDLASVEDPNLNKEEIIQMGMSNIVAASGDFELRETDPTSKYSGVFKGTFKTEFSPYTNEETKAITYEPWFYSENLPTHGAGYRFDGTWSSYTDPSTNKPVIWAKDLFRFGNEILKDFSYGERDVQINPAYRNLGWEDIWSGDNEWWKEAEQPKM